MLYFDASVVAPLFVTDVHSQVMHAWAANEAESFVLSDFGAAEFAAVVTRAHRIGKLNTRDVAGAFADFDRWRSRWVTMRFVRSSDIEQCENLIRDLKLKLSAPDALHLAIARADQMTLVTLDQRQAAAARMLRHPVLIPGR